MYKEFQLSRPRVLRLVYKEFRFSKPLATKSSVSLDQEFLFYTKSSILSSRPRVHHLVYKEFQKSRPRVLPLRYKKFQFSRPRFLPLVYKEFQFFRRKSSSIIQRVPILSSSLNQKFINLCTKSSRNINQEFFLFVICPASIYIS